MIGNRNAVGSAAKGARADRRDTTPIHSIESPTPGVVLSQLRGATLNSAAIIPAETIGPGAARNRAETQSAPCWSASIAIVQRGAGELRFA